LNKEEFLPKWIKFSGWLEILFGIMMALFIAPMIIMSGIQTIPFWTQFAGISLACMGILLLYSARDIKTFLIIPVISSLYRIILVIAEIIFVITYLNAPPAVVMPIFVAMFYDAGSTIFTLWILYDLSYFRKK